jgi:hypothetical protein
MNQCQLLINLHIFYRMTLSQPPPKLFYDAETKGTLMRCGYRSAAALISAAAIEPNKSSIVFSVLLLVQRFLAHQGVSRSVLSPAGPDREVSF